MRKAINPLSQIKRGMFWLGACVFIFCSTPYRPIENTTFDKYHSIEQEISNWQHALNHPPKEELSIEESISKEVKNPCIEGFQHSTIGKEGLFPSFTNFDLCKGVYDISTSAAPNPQEEGTHFSYTSLCGNGEISVKIGNITGKGFAGLSIRESLDPTAKMINIFQQAHNNITRREVRLNDAGEVHIKESIFPINNWLKIERKGNNINSYTSSNGVNWQPFSNLYLDVEECVYIGLAVQSDSEQNTTIALFDHLMVIEGIKIKTKPNFVKDQDKSLASNPFISDFHPKDVTKGMTRLNIEMPQASDAKVNIFNREGEQIQQKAVNLNIGPNTILFDVSEWPEGDYVAYISTERKTTPKSFAILE